MRRATIHAAAFCLLAFLLVGVASHPLRAQTAKQIVFHVRHIEESAVYIDVGRNSGLQEGMRLALFHSDSGVGQSTGAMPPSSKPIAELKVVIVADSSAVCEIVSSPDQIKIGDVGFVSAPSKTKRPEGENLIQAEDHPISIGFSDGDPGDDEAETAKPFVPVSLGQRHNAIRVGLDYDGTQVSGGFRASEIGFQVSSDMTHIAGTNWNFTGYWRSRFRQTYSGFNGAQLETLGDRIDRTYHIGVYYESPESAVIAGFGRLSVPGAPSLPTIDGGYFGRKVTHHVTLGIFGGSTPDPTAWDYNPNQRIAGVFTNLEYGSFSDLHLSGAEGLAMTAVNWRVARQFAFLENTVSWKHLLWFYNSTQLDAARTSPLPGGGSNGTGISFTSSSLRLQPIARLEVGLNHSYLNSLPTFDANLLGTTLLDKYIFQGLSVDARYELPYRISFFTQVGRAKSIADTKNMWNTMYGLSFGDILRSGVHVDVRYAKFDSSFGRGNYRALSLSRALKGSLQLDLTGGSQSLVSAFTANTSSYFVSGSAMWSLGPRYFFESGYTWSRGTTMNYQQWNTMFGYRFGGFGRR